MSRSFARSLALFERAARVIPGGIYGHTNPAATLPMASPYYAVRSEGCRYWDADDNEYLDFLCGYGPNVLGARHPEVEAAAEAPAREGRLFQPPDARRRGPRRTPRRARGFRRVGRVRQERLGHDHLGAPGRPRTHRPQENPHGRRRVSRQPRVVYARPRRVDRGRLRAHPRLSRGTISTPFETLLRTASRAGRGRHRDAVPPSGVRRFATARARFPQRRGGRLPPRGRGAHPRRRALRLPAAPGRVAPIFRVRAGPDLFFQGAGQRLPALGRAGPQGTPARGGAGVPHRLVLEQRRAHGRRAGDARRAGTRRRARAPRPHGRPVARGDATSRRQTRHAYPLHGHGRDAVPDVRRRANFYRSQTFCREAIRRGVFLHPHHNWFLCAAHQPADIDEALAVADAAFEVVREEFKLATSPP